MSHPARRQPPPVLRLGDVRERVRAADDGVRARESSSPSGRSLSSVREAAAGCRGCQLWRDATQTVFGAGPRRARIMLVGEMAGDREDREGRPVRGTGRP